MNNPAPRQMWDNTYDWHEADWLRLRYLTERRLGVEEAQQVAMALINNDIRVEQLGFYTKISDVGLTAVAHALNRTSTLQVLWRLLSCDKGGGVLVKGGSARETCEEAWNMAMRISSKLQILYLRDKDIGHYGAQALAKALTFDSSLRTLHMKGNHLGDEGATALGEALITKSSLKELFIGLNNIGDAGALALGEALKTNSTLEALDLHSNDIRDVGATALGEALTVNTNTALQVLHLHSNYIGDSGASALGEALKANSTLKELNLHSNSIGNVGVIALCHGLTTNMTLSMINIGGNKFGYHGRHALGIVLQDDWSSRICYPWRVTWPWWRTNGSVRWRSKSWRIRWRR